jgi:hypothetical protein
LGFEFWFRIIEAAGEYQNTFDKIKLIFAYLSCTQEFRSVICRKNLIEAQGEAVKNIIAILSICLLPPMSHDFVMLQGDPDDHWTGVPNQVGWDSVRVGSHGYLTYRPN